MSLGMVNCGRSARYFRQTQFVDVRRGRAGGKLINEMRVDDNSAEQRVAQLVPVIDARTRLYEMRGVASQRYPVQVVTQVHIATLTVAGYPPVRNL